MFSHTILASALSGVSYCWPSNSKPPCSKRNIASVERLALRSWRPASSVLYIVLFIVLFIMQFEYIQSYIYLKSVVLLVAPARKKS